MLFAHLPKCAGSSITNWLKDNFPDYDRWETNGQNPMPSVRWFQRLPQRSRFRYRLITGHCTERLLDQVHPDTFCFTVLRDPVERIVSFFYYYRRIGRLHYSVSLPEFAHQYGNPIKQSTLNRFDAVGTVQALPEFCDRLSSELGLSRFPGYHHNANEERPPLHQVAADTIEELESILADEIAVYNRYLPA